MGSQCKYAARNTRGLTSTMSQPSASGSMSKKLTSLKKTKGMSTTSNPSPSYRTMITNALHATKERKGLSRPAIMKYMVGASIVPKPMLLNKMLKKMSDEGKVVPGADAGKSGAGCFKLSSEEKLRLLQEEKLRFLQVENAALKEKLKAKGIDVKKVLKKKVSNTKKSNEVAKKNAKRGKVTKAVKSKPNSSKSKVSGVA